MIVKAGPLLAKNGAQFHARIEPSGYNQVSLFTQVRLGNQREPEQVMRTTHELTARDLVNRLAREAGFDEVVWEGKFCASVVYIGNAFQADWSIRVGKLELERDSTLCLSEQTARTLIKADASRLGYGDRIEWEDGYAE